MLFAGGVKPQSTAIGQALRFGLVAPVIFLVDWAILAGLSALGTSPYAGRLLSLAGSVCVGFFLNRWFTFRAAGRPTWAEVRAYALAAALGIVVNYPAFALAVRLGVTHAAAIAAGMLCAAAVTFFRFKALFRT